MQRLVIGALVSSVLGAVAAQAEPMPIYPNSNYARQIRVRPVLEEPARAPEPRVQVAAYQGYAEPQVGGGFLQFLFGGGQSQPRYLTEPQVAPAEPYARQGYLGSNHYDGGEPARPQMDPRYLKQMVQYDGGEKPGTLIINTRERFLYLVQPGGRALRYGIGVGRPGFTWAGVKSVSAKKEWPDWRPPKEMLARRPDLPTWMAGGPDNPLGARAMYLGSTLYRIHGSNEPWTIGTAVSSGCIRMRNEDVIDLYDRVKVGSKVVVI